jgi:UDP-4-amino-4,6-dideoxy-N-acetyl-beta-L-altrosamine transaminase
MKGGPVSVKQPPTAQPARVTGYGRQSISEADCQAVIDVLKSDWLTQGPAVDAFERALESSLGAPHAVSCANGTAALHLAALALGWGPGDVVLVPAITFLASANCAAYVGAEPFFVDIDERTLTIDPADVERHVQALRARGKRVRAVVGVDLAGHPCDWPALRAIADKHGLDLVDDACHALGAVGTDGERIGSGRHADLTVLSFHPVKHITTAEGGAVLTSSSTVAEHLRRLRSHGVVRGEEVADWEGPWHADMVELGFNYRLSDLQAALGTSQLRRLPDFVARRRAIAARYRERLAGVANVRSPEDEPGATHAYHLFVVRLAFDRIGRSRREVFQRCLARGVALQVHYRPVFMNTFYRDREINQGVESWTPRACAYYREAVSIPMFPDLTDADVDGVARILEEAIS